VPVKSPEYLAMQSNLVFSIHDEFGSMQDKDFTMRDLLVINGLVTTIDNPLAWKGHLWTLREGTDGRYFSAPNSDLCVGAVFCGSIRVESHQVC